MFDCAAENVACGLGAPEPGPTTFAKGAFLFVQRMAEPPGIVAGADVGEWGAVVAIPGFDVAPAIPGEAFANASHAIVTSVTGSTRSVRFVRYADGAFTSVSSVVRSTWIGNELITLVPVVGGLSADPESWDAYARRSAGGIDVSLDNLRSTADGPLLPFPGPPEYWLDGFDITAP
jgi:hypothetical protein